MSIPGNALPLAAAERSGAAGYERIPDPSERAPERYDSIGRRWVPRVIEHVLEPLGGWAQRALCREVDPDAWFPEGGSNGVEAKAICQRCDVRTQCLEYALRNGEREGIWGGLGPNQRAQLKRKGNAA